jgi:hypothetical protein
MTEPQSVKPDLNSIGIAIEVQGQRVPVTEVRIWLRQGRQVIWIDGRYLKSALTSGRYHKDSQPVLAELRGDDA